MKNTTLAAMLVMAAVGTAQAGGQSGTVGVGAEFGISSGAGLVGGGAGIGGLSANYDAGDFHVGGFLALYDPEGGDNTAYSIGGRFFYHLHAGSMSDFGVGGNVGIFSADQPGAGDRQTYMFLEPGFQIRMFPVSNVALSFTGGFVVGAIDAGGIALTGQVSGIAGVHYYFF